MTETVGSRIYGIDTRSQDRELLRFIATGANDEERNFIGTSWGDSVTVAIGKVYMSALGIPCRKMTITGMDDNDNIVAVAVGRKDGTWAMTPDISAKFRGV